MKNIRKSETVNKLEKRANRLVVFLYFRFCFNLSLLLKKKSFMKPFWGTMSKCGN